MYSIDEILNDEIDDNHEDRDLSENENQDLENVQQDEDGNQEDGAEEVKKDVDDDDEKKKKPRKKINRVNLNAERLKGARGLVCMESTFEKLKFRGKGFERQDLDTVMSALQHWCHRLYPKYTFDDTLEQIEKLGTKKSVTVLRKRIIMNMMDEDPALTHQSDDDNPITQQDSPPPAPVDKFDSLFDNRPPLRQREPSPELQITEEQLAIMERNRMLAAERRKARMAQQENNDKEKENLENFTEKENLENVTEKEYLENVAEKENLETFNENLDTVNSQSIDKSIVNSEMEEVEPMVES